ncbi:Gfo/Idh/MocA family oxidoreductase [Gilvimarinus sp. SDUM040013]|uniref:Gfo/Idh/MocA family oxidoreductase n=1 Tax=Gilvimarinus gilvus TaxID=3058038 RepID=A0ABU4RYK9_9GAMM|nr:Gfo/Idh/MocA family oxidoreductase [Gilvimarinus sp. SDUM040013]MDO3385618.1 Gfo/Idh/MocA family oxidoreductase [Gilvimarinus sp. SDUM040013]MDX6849952.1 Gfo/Idh/MocA family oxidoreductase [Gilvimarinus sp. SDUM040013]
MSTATNPVRLGIIGLGNIGQQHIQHIQTAVTGGEITALCSRQPTSIAGLESVQHFSDYRQLIDSGLVDAVLIATPTMAHFEQANYALAKGLHVLIEKPIGLSCHEGEQLLKQHQSEQQVFALMLNQRTDPLFVAMKEQMDSGRIGAIQRTHWTMTNWFRPEVYFQVSDWRATWKGEGGGLLLNQCIHNLDIFQWICGLPVSVRSFCSFGKYHDIEVEDEATAYLRYRNGASGLFVGSTGEAPGINRFDIVGDLGTLSFDGDRLTLFTNSESTSGFCKSTRDMFGTPAVTREDITPDRQVNQHARVIQNFIDAIREQAPLIAPAEQGLHSLALANAMLLSSWENTEVDLPLNSAHYQKVLERHIAQSSLRKKANIDVSIDMNKSYR